MSRDASSISSMTLRIDQLGRVVLPEQVRNSLNLHEGDALNLQLEGGRIVLEPVLEPILEGQLKEVRGMLVWTGAIDSETDLLEQAHEDRMRHALGS